MLVYIFFNVIDATYDVKLLKIITYQVITYISLFYCSASDLYETFDHLS